MLSTNKYGETAVTGQFGKGNSDVVSTLLENGANVNTQDQKDELLLMMTINLNIVNILLK